MKEEGGRQVVRVVREDPKRKGLLFAGTETGVYISFDAGGRWQALQMDLPAQKPATPETAKPAATTCAISCRLAPSHTPNTNGAIAEPRVLSA